MHYSEVWNIAGKLKQGEAFAFSKDDIGSAAACQLDSLLFDRVRRSDVLDFIANLEAEFSVSFAESPITGTWTMRKP